MIRPRPASGLCQAHAGQQLALVENYQSELHEFHSTLGNLQAELGVNQANQAARRGDMASLTTLLANIRPRLQARQTLSQSMPSPGWSIWSRKRAAGNSAPARPAAGRARGAAIPSRACRSGWPASRHKAAGVDRETPAGQAAADCHRTGARQAARAGTSGGDPRPVAGTVQQLAIHTQGAVVQPAQQLLVIVPNEGCSSPR